MPDSPRTSDSFTFKTDRPWPNPVLKVAAVLGHATPSSARLWLRTRRTGDFTLLLSQGETVGAADRAALREELGRAPLSLEDLEALLTPLTRLDFSIENLDSDTTTVLELGDLTADTRYAYVLYDRGRERVILGHNRLRGFRTPPAYEERRAFQFALISCHMPYKQSGLFRKRTEVHNIEMWDYLGSSLQRQRDTVDLVIAGGDQCYTDGVPTLDIWRYLNRRMRKESDEVLPDEASMLSWYRDIYRGYWGFPGLQEVFESFPTYMVWDDHEIGDGWGSHYLGEDGDGDGVRKLLPSLEDKGLTHAEGRELVERMFRMAKRAYQEYEHSHNPPTEEGVLDYSMLRGGCAFYVLDGRGQRDVGRESYRILGREQFDRFSAWAEGLDPEETVFLFVVSAVPVVHTCAGLVNADDRWVIDQAGLADDLRDSWEHELHDEERGALMETLFAAAATGIRVCILSGDVHVSAVFSLENAEGQRIYQLTSSAITYGLSRPVSWVLSQGAADDGETTEGHRFQRLALYAQSSYALISADPETGECWYKLYGEQTLEPPPSLERTAQTVPLNHSVAKIRLF
ncbi:MAG: alkaline phosphatase D family protein [Bryobacterales bacterium]|nr:alkaline phosphatase D family protein [Bryobacterales bacterium]